MRSCSALPVLVVLVLVGVVAAVPASAQKRVARGAPAAAAAARGATPGCSTGAADAALDVSGVRAALYTTGGLFWRGGDSTYEVPRGSGLQAVFAASLWISGRVGGELRFAGTTYSPWEYWPGPLDAAGTTTPQRCSYFDRLWSVRYADLAAYAAGGPAASDLATWPIAWGAPFYVDANGNSRRDPAEPRLELDLGDPGYGTRTISLAAGERPDIVGDQGIWWVMNDAGNAHYWSGTPPLRVEVQALAVAFDTPEAGVAQSTVYEMQVFNRSGGAIDDLRVGVFAETDLGQFNDDYLTGDAARGLMATYNGDAFDDGPGGYGASPPALGIDLLGGASGGWAITDLTSTQDRGLFADQILHGRFYDGTPLTRGGGGYNPGSTDVTAWPFDGDAVQYAFWSEEQRTPGGLSSVPGDRLMVVYQTVGTFGAGAVARLDAAILFAEGGLRADGAPRTRLHNLARLRDVSDAVQAAYDAGGTAALRGVTVAYTPPPPAPAAVALVAPADDADFNATQPPAVTFEWTAAPGARAYRVEASPYDDFSALTSEWTVFALSLTVDASDLPSHQAPWTYWRVTALSAGGEAPSDTRRFAYRTNRSEFALFTVTANAAGPLVPPQPGAAHFGTALFPTPSDASPESGVQQAQSTNRWLVFTTGAFESYDEWVERVTRGGANDVRLFPFDYEMRFTGTSVAAKNGFFGQTGADVSVPFELWNIGIGTPDDPSDDVRMIPVLHDLDGNGAYGPLRDAAGTLLDSPVSTGSDDPYLDGIYWHLPTNAAPGQAGYLAYENGGTVDLNQIGAEVFAHTTLVSWNGRNRVPWAPLPEPGTVFRIETAKPALVASGSGPVQAALALGVYPNPLAGGRAATVPFTLDAAGGVRLSVVDVLGREVAVLAEGARPAGRHEARLAAGRLAAGVYVVVLRAGDRRAVRTLTVVR